MPVTANDTMQIRALVKPLLGERAWGVALGHGSFLTLEFGPPMAEPAGLNRATQGTRGVWHLWVYQCAWRLDAASGPVVGSDDEREEMEAAAATLNELRLLDIDVSVPAGDTLLTFEGEFKLHIFAMNVRGDFELWMLFMPGGSVLTLGAGIGCTVTPATPS